MKTKIIVLFALATVSGCANHAIKNPFAALSAAVTPVFAASGDASAGAGGNASTGSPLSSNGAAPNSSGSGSGASNHSLRDYKLDLANRIAEANADKMHSGRPQALLRSVVVLKYTVDGNGKLKRSAIVRSNRDRKTESIALATLRNSAPFPKPPAHLLDKGQLQVTETWLFNNDGRFQLRTTAAPQMTE